MRTGTEPQSPKDYMVFLYGNAVRVRNRLDSTGQIQAAAPRLDLDSQNISLILQRYFNLYIVPIISDSRGVNLSIWLQIPVSVMYFISLFLTLIEFLIQSESMIFPLRMYIGLTDFLQFRFRAAGGSSTMYFKWGDGGIWFRGYTLRYDRLC